MKLLVVGLLALTLSVLLTVTLLAGYRHDQNVISWFPGTGIAGKVDVRGAEPTYISIDNRENGAEMEVLVEETSGRAGVALDLLLGAAIAYRDVIRRDRVLSAAGAYLHGACVAVLLQAIAFVSLILAGQRSPEPTDLHAGPFYFATVVGTQPWSGDELRQQLSAALGLSAPFPWLPELALLVGLVLALVVMLALPRALRSLR